MCSPGASRSCILFFINTNVFYTICHFKKITFVKTNTHVAEQYFRNNWQYAAY